MKSKSGEMENMIFIRKQIRKTFEVKTSILLAGLLFIPFCASAQKLGKSTSTPSKNTPGSTTNTPQGTNAVPAPVVIKEIPQIPDAGLVAKVGKGGLTKGEYDFYLLRFANKSRKTVSSLNAEERKTALNDGLDDEILFQAALEEGALNEKYVRFMMSSLFRSKQTLSDIRPDQFTDSDLKSYYDAHTSEFSTPAGRHMKGVKFDSAASASDFIKKMKKSKDPASAPEWVDFGVIAEGKNIVEVTSEVSEKALKLKKGQISEPLTGRLPTPCFVFFCVDQKIGTPLPFEEVKGKVKFALVGQKQKENYDNLLKKMGFDPKKISEDDALFLSALNNGMHRDISVRQYCINAYIGKQKSKREQLLPELKKKYPVTLIESAK